MRIRAGAFLLFAVIVAGLGCRSPFAPNVDRNRAPETWIVAAPQDTITLRNPDGSIDPPSAGTIPVRYHMYWAGSDQDGAVTGFYYAVVETLPLPPEGLPTVPPLPGPKASDYRFTSKTDTTFIFNVSEFSPSRQHAFFIYAVDDKGKGDPTPARFIFFALDRFPPVIYMPREWSSGTGPIARLLQTGTVLVKDTTCFISDSLDVRNPSRAPADTIPSRSRIDFKWSAVPSIAGTFVAGYRYKLDEPSFVSVGPNDTTISYNTGIGGDNITPGTKVFTLRAIDQAGGAREITRRFEMNYQPETWFSGPDLSLYPPGSRQFPYTGPRSFAGSLLSCDSLTVLPSARPQHRSFFEWYKDTFYVRTENETVHMNSLLIFHAGGADLDSPYLVQVGGRAEERGVDTTCVTPGAAAVIHPGGLLGQPIGFRSQISTRPDPLRLTINDPTPSSLFPVMNLSSNFHNPVVGAYINPRTSGKSYVVVRAQDADGKQDRRISSGRTAVRLADDVDSDVETAPDKVALRTRVMTFQVNYSPYLDFTNPLFFPKRPEDQGGAVSASPDRKLTLSLFANDPDPFDPQGAIQPPPGAPAQTVVLRYRVTVHGLNAAGRDTTYSTLPTPGTVAMTMVIDLPVDAPYIVGTNLTLDIELCDCTSCETLPGSGKCVHYFIPVTVPPPAPGAATSSSASATPSGSGTTHAAERSLAP